MAKKSKDTIHNEKVYGKIKKQYKQASIKLRIEALFLDNIGKIISREQILQVATNPITGNSPKTGIKDFQNYELMMVIPFFHGVTEVGSVWKSI